MSDGVSDEPDSEPTLGMDLPAAVAPATPAGSARSAYRVLARKYRPQRFSELIGQDAMVQTLSNAIRRDRLAHAFLMTGVRGVGKTSTARLIAKGLNCIGADGQGGATIDPCGTCDPCVAIAEGRHIDVIEMDAASHTGVDDVREIIEAVRYAAVSARYKIYIIDEVHMLSKNAFNALLKTLEEPPAHVKFLFATTEVNKVPVTVLSRCQRFDLRRITPDLLFNHFNTICRLEQVDAEERALWLIASAAEGSVRDGLSILDQAIAHADLDGAGRVTAHQVQEMLGLADGGAARTLFALLLDGDTAALIDAARSQYALGVEPLALVRGLMTLAHGVALARASRNDDPAQTPEDRAAVADWAKLMGMARVQRLWQLLTRAHDEVARSADPLMALEMALLRLAHAGTMPDPDDLARLLRDGAPGLTRSSGGPQLLSDTPPPSAAPSAAMASPAQSAHADQQGVSITHDAANATLDDPPRLPTLEPVEDAPAAANDVAQAAEASPLTIATIVAILTDSGQLQLASLLRREGRLVSVRDGTLALSRSERLTTAEGEQIARALHQATRTVWQVSVVDAAGAPTMAEQRAAERDAAEAAARTHPLVQAVLAQFPDAELRLPTANDDDSAMQRRSDDR